MLHAPNFHFSIRDASLTSVAFLFLLPMDLIISLQGQQQIWGLEQSSFSLDRWREILFKFLFPAINPIQATIQLYKKTN